MKFFQRNTYFVLAWIVFALFAVPALTFAQTDEIQVYDAAIAEKGKFNLMIHSNFIAAGQKTPAFPGGLIPDHSFNGTAEWAWGVTDWFEQGLYLPVYTIYSQGRGGSINGFKLRELFVRPHADDHTFFYGVNFEFSVNYTYWESRHITSEVRPIVGCTCIRWTSSSIRSWIRIIPGGFGNLEFVPATRIAYNFNDKWAAAARRICRFRTPAQIPPETGPVPRSLGRHGSQQQVSEYRNRRGIWRDAWGRQITFKLMVSRDLN